MAVGVRIGCGTRHGVGWLGVRNLLVFLVLLLGVGGFARPAHADPWLAPGNVQARQDVELLQDSGVIDIPITTWPIPWGSLAAALAPVQVDTLSPAQQGAYERLLEGIRAVQAGGNRVGYMLEAAPGRPALRWFGATPRGKEGVGIAWAGTAGRFAWRLNASGVYGSRDHQRARFDGSYVSFALGNWILTAGQIDQYWGPAWSGSLILGTNSRPVPGLMLTNYTTKPFDSPILHWLGPWTFTIFAGQLGNARYVAHPFLLGARFAFVPLRGLEIGFSRTAEFGGAGRSQSWPCLWQTIIARTNKNPKQGVDCANQLGAVDARFHIPHTRFDFYGQMNAEDTAGGSPSKWSDLFGLSRWGTIGDYGGNYRVFLEYANTTSDSYKDPIPNVEYENGRYKSGYRYRGVDLGYPTDNDSELFTVGVNLIGVNGGVVTFLLRHGTLNRDNSNSSEPWGGNKFAPVRTALDALNLYFRPSFWGGHLYLGAGLTRWAPYGLPAELGLHGEVSWQVNF